jgi:hypothetical protein
VSLLRSGCRKNPDCLDVVRSDPDKLASDPDGSASYRRTESLNDMICLGPDRSKQDLTRTYPHGPCSSCNVEAHDGDRFDVARLAQSGSKQSAGKVPLIGAHFAQGQAFAVAE